MKLLEQCGWSPGGIHDALALLLAVSNGRGGGDVNDFGDDDAKSVKNWCGRWGGDRIAVIGDYTTNDDLPAKDKAQDIYRLCDDVEGYTSHVAWKLFGQKYRDKGKRIEELSDLRPADQARVLAKVEKDKPKLFTDISENLIPILENAHDLVYWGEGWRNRTSLDDLLEDFGGSHSVAVLETTGLDGRITSRRVATFGQGDTRSSYLVDDITQALKTKHLAKCSRYEKPDKVTIGELKIKPVRRYERRELELV